MKRKTKKSTLIRVSLENKKALELKAKYGDSIDKVIGRLLKK